MTPAIEDIIAALLRGAMSPEQAIAAIQNHVDMRGDLRELFAAHAMQALLSSIEVSEQVCNDPLYDGNNFAELVAQNSYRFADAMLKARRA